MKIWAHRGCSQCYPENTITAFEKAMEIPGLAGIELDIQLTRDGEMVVIHDERVERTTDGIGFVRDFTLSELKTLHIRTGKTEPEYIPTMKEVLELTKPQLQKGMRINIELKNSVYYYEGMEEKIVKMVHDYGVQDSIVYSSFYHNSLMKVHELDPKAEVGTLSGKASYCLFGAKGMEQIWQEKGMDKANDGTASPKIALHPYGYGLDISPEMMEGRTVRAYFGGHLYPEKPTGGVMDLDKFAAAGVTDVFLNEPEKYLN